MLWIFQLPEKSSDFGWGSNPRTRVPEASIILAKYWLWLRDDGSFVN
jgi:hypothetical protein